MLSISAASEAAGVKLGAIMDLTKPKSKPHNMDTNFLVEICKHVVIAIVGGVAKYFSDYYKGNPFNWKMFLAKLTVCGFVGFLFSLIFNIYATEWRFVASALGGYVGTEILDASVFAFVKSTGKRFLGVDVKVPRRPVRKKRARKPVQ